MHPERMERIVRPEILDELSADDPRAVQSRRDLRKINAFMGHAAMVAHELRAGAAGARRIVELGAGDGTLLLRVATRLGRSTEGVQATLVDRRPSITGQTRESFKELGWTVDEAACDVFEWLQRPGIATADAAIANLFLHHFEDAPLASLLDGLAKRTRLFIACEPRRSRAGLAGVSLMPLIGCNAVTLHDGDISVRAGFRDRELSRLWPAAQGWHLDERRAGLFTHLFVARITAARGLSVSAG